MKNLMNGTSANHPSLFGDDVKFERISYAYKGNRIEFRLNGSLMVNASEMAKPFNKKCADWLRLPSAISYITTLIEVRSKCDNLTLTENQPNNTYKSYYGGLVVTQRGGVNPGTWMHEDVALEFARWLSPEFAIWCNDRIKEILTGRKVMVDKEFIEYINATMSKFPEMVNQYAESLSKRYGYSFNLRVPDAVYGMTWNDKRDIKQNIENLLSCYQNTLMAGTFQTYRAYQLEYEAGAMRKFLIEASQGIYDKFKIYPN